MKNFPVSEPEAYFRDGNIRKKPRLAKQKLVFIVSKMFERLSHYTQRFAYHRFSGIWLFFYSVIESVFFPVSPEILLIPMTLVRPNRAFLHAIIAAIGSATGGIIGYGIGYWGFDSLARPILEWSCTHFNGTCPDTFVPMLTNLFDRYGFGIIIISAMSPVLPYRLVILAAGMGQMVFVPFAVLSLVVHWLRYTLICWAVARYGDTALRFIRQNASYIFAGIGAVGLVVLLLVAYF